MLRNSSWIKVSIKKGRVPYLGAAFSIPVVELISLFLREFFPEQA
jgi:hypothetical protein